MTTPEEPPVMITASHDSRKIKKREANLSYNLLSTNDIILVRKYMFIILIIIGTTFAYD